MRPRIVYSPALGNDVPVRIFSRVDLPAPLLPTRPTHWPSATSNVTPSSAWTGLWSRLLLHGICSRSLPYGVP
jgi:hypothetical protein